MDFKPTPEDAKYRDDLRAWLADTFPPDEELPNMDSVENRKKAYMEYQGKLFAGGYAGIRYPKKYGGQDGTVMQEIIVADELVPYNATHAAEVNAIGFGMALPTIHTVGTEEQKDMFLKDMLAGKKVWIQAFSEPNSGSDAAAASCMAIKTGDHYVVNGQKVWITSAQYADYCMLLCRTDPNAPKHRGLSYLLVDMKTAGIEVRPIKQISGGAEFNEVFFDDAKIPENMLVGQENAGWGIAITTLMFERVMGDLTMATSFMRVFNQLVSMAQGVKRGGKPILENDSVRQKMAEIYIRLMALKYNGFRSASSVASGGIPGPEGSIGKLYWSHIQQDISELAVEILGPAGQIMEGSPDVVDNGMWQYSYLMSKASTIAAGTTEILKNIISERVMGLPKDSARASFKK